MAETEDGAGGILRGGHGFRVPAGGQAGGFGPQGEQPGSAGAHQGRFEGRAVGAVEECVILPGGEGGGRAPVVQGLAVPGGERGATGGIDGGPSQEGSIILRPRPERGAAGSAASPQ